MARTWATLTVASLLGFTIPFARADDGGPNAPDSPPSQDAAASSAPPGETPAQEALPVSAPRREPDFTAPAAPAFTGRTAEPTQTDARTKDERDANADRVVVLPTAYVHPAGTVYVSSYDILLLQAGYAVSDRTQISLTASPPLDGTIVPVDASVKTVIAQDGPLRAAAIGSVSGIWGLDQGSFVIGRVGAVAELCLEPSCQSSASIGGTIALVGPDTLAMTGVGVVWRVASWLSLLMEVDTLVPLARDAGAANGIALLPGVRLPHRTWSLDFALARVSDVAPTLPLLVFTYRFLR